LYSLRIVNHTVPQMRNQGRIAGECDGTRTDTLSGRISLGLGFSCEFELSTPLNGLGTTHLLLSLVVINLNTGKSLWLVLFPLWLDRWVILTVSLLKKIRPVMLCLTQRTCPGRRRLMTRREFRQPCVACLATCARVWISSSLLKTKPIVVSVYAKVCCGPYRLVFACVRMLEERGGGKCGHVALREQLSKQTVCPTRRFPTVLDTTTK
jgi:hypothetical protein